MLSWTKSRIRAMKKAKRSEHKSNNESLPQICRMFQCKSKSSSKLSSASEEAAALMGIPNSNSSSSSSSNFASKSVQPKKLKSLVSAAKSDGKPSKAKKMLSKFMKRLLFFRKNSVSIPGTASSSSSSSSMAATTGKKSATTTTILFTGKFHKTQNKQSLNFCVQCPPNRRLYEGFCCNSGGKAQQYNSHSTYHGIYLAILVIAILFGLLQSRISAMLCAFSCCFFFNAMEIAVRRAVYRCS